MTLNLTNNGQAVDHMLCLCHGNRTALQNLFGLVVFFCFFIGSFGAVCRLSGGRHLDEGDFLSLAFFIFLTQASHLRK